MWNFRGEMVTRFEDHVLWHPDSNTSNIYITSTQDYILSYCRRRAPPASEELGACFTDSLSHAVHLPLTYVVHLLPCRCRPEGDTRSGGTINISSISSGKCAATLGLGGEGLGGQGSG